MRFEPTGKIFDEFLLNKSDKMSGYYIANLVKLLKENVAHINIALGDNEETQDFIAATFVESERKFLRSIVEDGISTGANILTPKQNPKSLKDIIGYSFQKKIINRQAKYIKVSTARKNESRRMRIEPSKGILLYGFPCNGKS